MARPRSFDKDTVLDQVMVLFWEKGYGATTMMDIQTVTGLKPGSLYDSFGDKHQLFLDAIDHYRTTIVRKRLLPLHSDISPRRRLTDYFDNLLAFSLGEGQKLGCLMSNCAIEMAPHDTNIQDLVQANQAEIIESFRLVIQQGQDFDEFTSTENAEDLAKFLLSTVQGIRIMAKSAAPEDTLKTSIRLALNILG